MKNEAQFKSLIKKSIRAQKGFSLSLAAPMISGLPDLYCVLPSYIPVLLEAKWLGTIERNTFKRKIPFTPLQVVWIQECHEVSPYSAMGVVGLIYKGEIHCALVEYGTELFNTFDHTFIDRCSYVTYNKDKKTLDILELFAKVPIPRIRELSVKGLIDLPNGPGANQTTLAA